MNQVWEINCKENHDHTFDRPRTPTPDILPETPESSLPSSPSTLTATTVSRPPSPSLTLPPRTPLRDRAKDLKFLGDFRPPAVHLSPQRATQLFTRVLSAHSVLNPVPLPIEPIMPPQTEDKRASSSKQVEIQEPLAGEETKGLIFAVAGNTRLFKERCVDSFFTDFLPSYLSFPDSAPWWSSDARRTPSCFTTTMKIWSGCFSARRSCWRSTRIRCYTPCAATTGSLQRGVWLFSVRFSF